ncbi:hypothetical protein ACFOSD_15690, partial [Salinispirillum marinum]
LLRFSGAHYTAPAFRVNRYFEVFSLFFNDLANPCQLTLNLQYNALNGEWPCQGARIIETFLRVSTGNLKIT